MPNKISLTRSIIDRIWEEYNAGSNRLDIARDLGITEWSVRKIIGGKCRKLGQSLSMWYERNTVPISYVQEQIILGSLLGDASLSLSDDEQYELQMGHCLEQKEWLSHKAKILGSNVRAYIKDESSFSVGKEFFHCSYFNKYELKRIHNLCFRSKIKVVSKEWASKLDSIAIATWFMDDGTSSFGKNGSVILRFSTLSFPKSQLKILQARLKELGISTTLQKHADGKGLVIAIRQKFVNPFMDLIEPHIVTCMKYKVKRRANEPNFRFSGKDIRSANGVL